MVGALAKVEKLLTPFMLQPFDHSSRTLQRFARLLDSVDSPQRSLRAIHVVGTSGKTSVCYFLRSLLLRAGWTPGLTVSPHVVAVTDRVQIGDGPIDADTMLQELSDFLDRLHREVRSKILYLDLMMGFAWWLFARTEVDCAVVEAGVGGLHDRSNLLAGHDKLCVIGDIGLDHVGKLGHSLAEIAVHKAGIIKPGCHVIALAQQPTVMSVISAVAARRRASLEFVDGSAAPPVVLPDFQQRNWALAVAAFRRVSRVHGLRELEQAEFSAAALQQPPGRMEWWHINGRTLLLDGAHNPQKMAGLRRSLTGGRPSALTVVANMVRSGGSRVEDTCRELARFDGRLLVPDFGSTPVPVKQSVPAVEFAGRLRSAGCTAVDTVPNIETALRRALAGPRPVLVTGSLYLVSLARAILEEWGGRREGLGPPSAQRSLVTVPGPESR